MGYKTIRDTIEDMAKDNHKDFVKAVISMEKGINDESALDKLYDAYMANDTINLLHEDFDYMIEDLREQGQIKDLPYVQQEKDDLVNIAGNIVGKVDIIERENKDGEAFKVVNFSVVSKDDEGNKVYHNCSAYGDKGDRETQGKIVGNANLISIVVTAIMMFFCFIFMTPLLKSIGADNEALSYAISYFRITLIGSS